MKLRDQRLILGRYNRTTLLTYLGVVAAVLATWSSISGNAGDAMALLAAAGLCDLFDGPIARRFEASDADRRYGVELDSLADTVAFVAVPNIILLSISTKGPLVLGVAVAYALAGVVRLATFGADYARAGRVSGYVGLPVTYVALILPILYLVLALSGTAPGPFIAAAMIAMAGAFISNFHVPKPSGATVWLLAAIVGCAGLLCWLAVD